MRLVSRQFWNSVLVLVSVLALSDGTANCQQKPRWKLRLRRVINGVDNWPWVKCRTAWRRSSRRPEAVWALPTWRWPRRRRTSNCSSVAYRRRRRRRGPSWRSEFASSSSRSWSASAAPSGKWSTGLGRSTCSNSDRSTTTTTLQPLYVQSSQHATLSNYRQAFTLRTPAHLRAMRPYSRITATLSRSQDHSHRYHHHRHHHHLHLST